MSDIQIKQGVNSPPIKLIKKNISVIVKQDKGASLTTPIEHSTGSPSQSNQARKKK